MLRRVRTPLLLVALLLALFTGSYWLWHNLHASGGAKVSGSPTLDTSELATQPLSKDAPDGPESEEQLAYARRAALNGREPPGRDGARDAAGPLAVVTGQLLDIDGHALHDAKIYIARWIEEEPPPSQWLSSDDNPFATFATFTESPTKPRIPARIAVHLPIDIADPCAAGLPIPLRFVPDDSGSFRAELAPGRWRLLVRSSMEPYERNDLLLAAGESLDLGRLVLRPGIVYQFQFGDAQGERIDQVRAAPLLEGLGADFPPLAGALSVPFLLPRSERQEYFYSLTQRPGPLRVWFAIDHRRPEQLDLDPSELTVGVSFQKPDLLRGNTQHTTPGSSGAFAIHARPLDFFETPIPAEYRGDLAHAGDRNHAFELELPDRSESYELRLGFGNEPPLLESPWSPAVFLPAEADDDPRPRTRKLNETLSWRPDASLHFELVAPGSVRDLSAPEGLLTGAFARGQVAGTPIAFQGLHGSLAGLRKLRTPEATLWIRIPGTSVLHQTLGLLPGGAADLGQLHISALPSIPVRVIDAQNSLPIANASIRSFEEIPGVGALQPEGPLESSTDARGFARVYHTGLDLSRLEIRAPGYAPAFPRTVDRAPDGSIQARLYRGATVRVRVFDSDAAPVPAVAVDGTRAEWTPDLGPPSLMDRASTDIHGWATFTHVPPGQHAFRIHPTHESFPVQPSEWTLVGLAEGETRELSVSTRTRAQLLLRVADRSGPRSDVRLTLESSSPVAYDASPLSADDPLPYGVDAWTDSRGEARFDSLPPEFIRITLTLPECALRLRRTFRLRSGPQTIVLDLSDATTLATPDSTPTLTALELRLLPPPIALPLGNSLVPLADLDLEHTSRLDRRHGRPDLTFPPSNSITFPTELLEEHLLLTSPSSSSRTFALELQPDPTQSSPPPALALTPTTSLELLLDSLRPHERYVLVLGRQPTPPATPPASPPASPPNTQLPSDPAPPPAITAAILEALASDASFNPGSFFVERTFPFVATSSTLTLSLTNLLPGESLLRLYRLTSQRALRPVTPPQPITLSPNTRARHRLTPTD